MLVACSVRPSLIDGLGLFAKEAIPAGTIVSEFAPRFEVIVSVGDLEGVPAPVQAFFDRFGYARADMPGCLVVDIDDGRYINHEDDPNLDCATPGRGVARRDIAVGEEITCNYDQLEPRSYEMLPPRAHFEDARARLVAAGSEPEPAPASRPAAAPIYAPGVVAGAGMRNGSAPAANGARNGKLLRLAAGGSAHQG